MIRSYLEIHPDKKFILFPRPDKSLWTSDFLCLVNAIIGLSPDLTVVGSNPAKILRAGNVYDFAALHANVDT